MSVTQQQVLDCLAKVMSPRGVPLTNANVLSAITVTDGGVGLKTGEEDLVFNRFWRADKSRKRHSGGTGLGLAIAREDAQLHGGTLDAIGEFGVGSQFRLVLPRHLEAGFTESPLPLEAPRAAETAEPPEGADHSADSAEGFGGEGGAVDKRVPEEDTDA